MIEHRACHVKFRTVSRMWCGLNAEDVKAGLVASVLVWDAKKVTPVTIASRSRPRFNWHVTDSNTEGQL